MIDRLPPLPPEEWDAAQREAAEELMRGPRGAVLPPFVPLLRSPELMTHAQRMGAYLRYRSAIGQRLSELAILVTARQWSQRVEWAIHAPIALEAGIAQATIDAIASGRRPGDMPADDALVHDFCVELHTHQSVSDATWQAAVVRFGERGAVDLVALTGYYTLLSMVMNAARTAVPDSPAAPLEPLTP
ncbi:MAG: carboxymuconolactone decarboxylase family protein [Burkholderiales bacterium]|nr:carboxymuconolactone decarboxylase family protein [Burkholderiales bacterium]MDE2457493.1 carboxymuconolactone decarboxylase family protein [Burkholderiales bacterium]